jgi:hypothetical protein
MFYNNMYVTLQSSTLSALNRRTVQPFTESDDTRCCDNTFCPPKDRHVNARNVEDCNVTYTLLYNKVIVH